MPIPQKPPVGDWDQDDGARYHRPRKPVEVRRHSFWKQSLLIAARILLGGAAVLLMAGAAFAAYQVATSSVFHLGGLEDVEVVGADRASAEAVRQPFAEDVGRNLFDISLRERREAVEEVAWVESATVQRLLPSRLRVYVRERTPVAFLRQGASLWLVDAHGVLLPPPESASYSFPVLTGLPDGLSREERQARVALYLEFVQDLNRDSKNFSSHFSEINLGDPENLRASVTEGDGAVWLYFGRGRYQEKYETFLQYRPRWQGTGETVRAVDLRFRGQIVLNPDTTAEKQER